MHALVKVFYVALVHCDSTGYSLCGVYHITYIFGLVFTLLFNTVKDRSRRPVLYSFADKIVPYLLYVYVICLSFIELHLISYVYDY